MKNKKLTYILVPLVGLIWGLVIYKIFIYTDDTDYSNQTFYNVSKIEEIPQKLDTFSIIADYKDPFLGKRIIRYESTENDAPVTNTETKNTVPKQTQTVQQKSILKWPAIEYGGIIYNAKTQKTVALVKINNQEFLAKPGETISKINLLEIFPDSIRVQYEEEVKSIKRN